MDNKKNFELTTETRKMFGRTLFRIKALKSFNDVKVGDLGGFIEKEENLSENAWVCNDACVYGNARVYGNACVYGNARIYGDARVYGNAWVFGNARIYGEAEISGDAHVYGNARIYGEAEISRNAWVYGEAEISGDTCIDGDMKICDAADLSNNNDYVYFNCLGSSLTFFKCKDGHIHVSWNDDTTTFIDDSFDRSLYAFEKEVKKLQNNKYDEYAKGYLPCIEIVKIHFGLTDDEV